MRIVPFPQRNGQELDGPVAELEAALTGDRHGPVADSWRELRSDVRALAPPMSAEFERELRERIEERAATPPRPRGVRSPTRSASAHAHARAWLGSGLRPRLLAGSGMCVAAAIVTLVVIAPWRASIQTTGGTAKDAVGARRAAGALGTSGGVFEQVAPSVKRATAAPSGADAGLSPTSPAAPTAESARARMQQRAASITLVATPEALQSVADRVARLAVREGGYVQSSQVHLQHGAAGEANLDLNLPSARLSAALASLAQLAPTRAESQSLQDITDEYSAARTKLADAFAERQALLRALARASTQGQIESLHARLALAGGAITRARTALQSVSKRGSSSAVEVTVLGAAHASGGGLTLGKGLHDVGDVLTVALVVLIIALAVLVPLAILVALLVSAWRVARRYARERALS
ncbi:MAG TPA: DUF4349 domain-containing protein [Solirubrobacteraceae bacterium]|nr:DUF4349 domain-containing protein [Solirubrobacteraceae bacterium]